MKTLEAISELKKALNSTDLSKAQVMVAAPELLEACKAMLERFSKCKGDGAEMLLDNDHPVRMAFEAIKKATQ